MKDEINLVDIGPPIQGDIPGLKDFFATSALVLFSGTGERVKPASIARVCYDVSEAMIKEKHKRKTVKEQ